MKQVVVRPAAAADIEDAYQWYESQRPGLGEEFLVALRLTRDRVPEHPEAFPVLHRGTRRALIPERFPYGLFTESTVTPSSLLPACTPSETRGSGRAVRDGGPRVTADHGLALLAHGC